MRLVLALAISLVLCASPALAQPLPASLRSAGVTEAQWGQAQGVIRVQAASLRLREEAVRTLAVEIFEGQPGQSFETYIELIRDGAARLPQIIAAARALDPRGDAALSDLQRRAVAAAEAGRLREALALQDEYAARFRSTLMRAVEQPLLDLAASYEVAGDTAYALGDHLGAASRFALAAETAPASAIETRWRYRAKQAFAIGQRGDIFVEPARSEEAVRLFETVVLPLAPRDRRPADWALTQNDMGDTLRVMGQRGVPGALERAAAAIEAALTVRTREADPAGWALSQANLGNVLLIQGELGSIESLERAVAAYEAALTATTREADPGLWAVAQMSRAIALAALGDRGQAGALERAVEIFEEVLTVRTRAADPAGWAQTHANLGGALMSLGDLGAPGALERAEASYEAALTVQTRDSDPDGWASIQINRGHLFSILGERGDARARDRALEAYQAALIVMTRERSPRLWAVATYGLALIYGDTGRTDEARAAARGALEAFEETSNTYLADDVRIFLAELER
ncbi:MAG: hypothetical protein AB7H66_01780 [Hyphomonadaceae bacterium]